MTAVDHSVFECGYVTHEGGPGRFRWSWNKAEAFPSAIFPVRERGRTGKVGYVLFTILRS